MDLLIKNVVILCDNIEKNVNVLIEGGIIVDIKENNANFVEKHIDIPILDGSGKYLLPGLIDMNCEICEPGFDYKEDMITVSKSGARSGFTSLTCSPNTNPAIDNKIIVKYIKQLASDDAIVNIFPYGQMTKGGLGEEISEIGEMQANGIVAISDGNVSISNNYLIMNIFSYSKMFDMPVITFCESNIIKNKGIINKGKVSMMTGLAGIPASAEEVYVARNIILAKEQGAKLHITKISTKGSVDIIRIAKSMGVDVTCDTSPHYICLTEDKLLNYETYYKVSPPLRTSEDNMAIIEGLKDGTIDAISTAHSPESSETKKREFEVASFGISGIEPSFLVCYNALVKTGHLTLEQLVNKLSLNPYNILNIKNKGKISIGFDADLFLFDKYSSYIVKESNFATKAKYSMYNNIKFSGNITHTIVNGNIVFEQKKVVSEV